MVGRFLPGHGSWAARRRQDLRSPLRHPEHLAAHEPDFWVDDVREHSAAPPRVPVIEPRP